jgi:hypothetical protein
LNATTGWGQAKTFLVALGPGTKGRVQAKSYSVTLLTPLIGNVPVPFVPLKVIDPVRSPAHPSPPLPPDAVQEEASVVDQLI